ncbi:MAG TPA: hypothetical protein VF547_00380 [Allosphingosinicella sp.]|jgi:hypothetical protein
MHRLMITCSTDRPWGLHAAVRSDEDCPRCGWTAPGPLGDALAGAREPDGDPVGGSICAPGIE